MTDGRTDRHTTTANTCANYRRAGKNLAMEPHRQGGVKLYVTYLNLFMAALCNIFALWFLSIYLSVFLSFFLAQSQRSETGCLPYFHTWCGLSANLECMSEVCCTRLADNTGRKDRHFGTIAQLCRAISSELRHVSTIGRQYLIHMS